MRRGPRCRLAQRRTFTSAKKCCHATGSGRCSRRRVGSSAATGGRRRLVGLLFARRGAGAVFQGWASNRDKATSASNGWVCAPVRWGADSGRTLVRKSIDVRAPGFDLRRPSRNASRASRRACGAMNT